MRRILATLLAATALAVPSAVSSAHSTTDAQTASSPADRATQTLTTNVKEAETGQPIALDATIPSIRKVIYLALERANESKKPKFKTVTTRRGPEARDHVFNINGAGFGTKLFRVVATYKNGDTFTTSTVAVTMFGWVPTKYFTETADHIWTYDGKFIAKQVERDGWYTVGAVGRDRPYFTEFAVNVCKAFRGAPVLQDASETGSQSTFTFGPPDVPATQTVVRNIDSPIEEVRIDFTGLSRFLIEATNDFDVRDDGFDGADAAPAIAGSAFLCSVNDTSIYNGPL